MYEAGPIPKCPSCILAHLGPEPSQDAAPPLGEAWLGLVPSMRGGAPYHRHQGPNLPCMRLQGVGFPSPQCLACVQLLPQMLPAALFLEPLGLRHTALSPTPVLSLRVPCCALTELLPLGLSTAAATALPRALPWGGGCGACRSLPCLVLGSHCVLLAMKQPPDLPMPFPSVQPPFAAASPCSGIVQAPPMTISIRH